MHKQTNMSSKKRFTLFVKRESLVPCIRDNHGMGNAGIDLLYHTDHTVPKQSQSNKISLGFGVRLWNHQTNSYTGYYLWPRSSCAKTPLRMSNSIGLIDAGYTGQLVTCADNVGNADFVISSGTALFQLHHPDFLDGKYEYTVEYVSAFPETVRGDGGFGSTDRVH